MYGDNSQVSFSCLGLSDFPALLIEEDFFSPLDVFWLLCQNYLPVCIGVYFWDLSSVPLVCGSVFLPIPYCFDDCLLVVSFEVRECDTFGFALFSQDCSEWASPLTGRLRLRAPPLWGNVAVGFPRPMKSQCCLLQPDAASSMMGGGGVTGERLAGVLVALFSQ